jgi:signal transduction histidine kinase
MRRRMFWAIAGVAALTGLLVLGASLYATQRAAIDATYRELTQSADEAVTVIQDSLDRGPRIVAAVEFLRLLEGDEYGRLFNAIRGAAGGSEIGFAAVGPDGRVHSNSPLFGRLTFDPTEMEEGRTETTSSNRDELVVVQSTGVQLVDSRAKVYVAIAREAPVVRVRDHLGALLLLTAGVVFLAALLARVLSGQITARLRPLAAASNRVAAGDMTARVPDLADPELDQVATAFNEMAADLEKTREREREFILGVGHDLRTPLTTIGGYAEAMEAGEFDDAEQRRVGAVLGVQSRQLGRLIEDLSTLAGLDGPEFGLRTEQVDAGAHVAEVVEGFRLSADSFGVDLEVDHETGLVLETDPDRLAQIAQNLVENALRHTPEGGRVHVSVTGVDEVVRLVFEDTGTGIAPDDLPHVFDRHFVGRQRSLRNEGSGLGLSIVKGLVDRMNGSVSAASAQGEGTTITVELARTPS